MAKKAQAVQLQTEVNNDEDWEKLLQKDGLIIVDIYSEWCGPCSGMAAILKKIKLEIGGDMLQLAVAKADNITALKRFRNKSEPTWMFIANGKMVNFMFGANSPKLTRLIIDEIKKEKEAREGRRERVEIEIDELTEEERERIELVQNAERELMARELAKAKKELQERRKAEANNILENLSHLGVIIIFPHAKGHYKEAFDDLFGEAGLTITQTEKQIQITKSMLEELTYFNEEQTLENVEYDEIFSKPSMALLVKRSSENLPNAIDDVIAQMIFGNMRKPPGEEKSPYQKLLIDNKKAGVLIPETSLARAMALKLIFPSVSGPFRFPDEKPIPPHVAVSYDAFKYKEVMDLMLLWPGQVMNYGFFTSFDLNSAELIAKTVEKFENKTIPTTYEEQMILQLSKENVEAYNAFLDLGPSYLSLDAVEGEKECKIFFPPGYTIPDEEVAAETKKKSKKKSKAKPSAAAQLDEAATGEIILETAIDDHQEKSEEVENFDDELECAVNDEEDDEEEAEGECEEEIGDVDKATSPMEQEDGNS